MVKAVGTGYPLFSLVSTISVQASLIPTVNTTGWTFGGNTGFLELFFVPLFLMICQKCQLSEQELGLSGTEFLFSFLSLSIWSNQQNIASAT